MSLVGHDRLLGTQGNPQEEVAEGELSCETLDNLIGEGTRLLHTLHVIWHDLGLLKQGKRIVYALDFSEIFSFLWPSASRNYKIVFAGSYISF